ncbi:MAG TPA: hypothetical protein VET23_06120, partial [Chitinophagaceae bacterium]|nr:hypothetical protein [Chitinophagaceae bacterium]
MNLVVLADDQFREELLEHGLENTTIVNWLKDVDDVTNFPAADAYIDLLFDNDSHRIKLLQKFESGIVIVNSVITTLKSLPRNFTRANGWPTFLKRSIIEVSCNEENMKRKAEEIFSCFHKKAEWVPDVPGFITLRVVAAIVNEAYFGLE